MASEVELKLRIATSDIAHLKYHAAISGALVGKPKIRSLTSIYYDTPQLALLDLGISLRVRRVSRNWIQTVKKDAKALVGLYKRYELEDVIAFGHPDFSKITEPALTKVFDNEDLRTLLAPIFSTEVKRTEWQLAFDNGDQIELALDLGELVVGEKREPISEIELELKSGNAGRLFEFALCLQHNIPLEFVNSTKAQRGYAHYRYQPPIVVKAKSIKMHRDWSADEAMKLIAWECVAHLQGNQDMVLNGEDIEGVHQMRIALRRLRSAFNVFRQIASKQSCASFIEELRWITGVLGIARDLDVFVKRTLPPLLEQLHDQPSLIQLNEIAEYERQQAYVEVRKALLSQRYQRLLLVLGDWLENERWKDASSVEYSVFDIADAKLAERYKQLKKHGRRLMHAHEEERHATRLAAKKLRYAAEFFVSFYPKSRSHDFLQALGKLLDILGKLNDTTTTMSLIHRIIDEHPESALNEALYLFTGWNACNVMLDKKDMGRILDQFLLQKML